MAPLLLLTAFAPLSFARGKTVAITVDDLPYAGGEFARTRGPAGAADAVEINRRLLAAFKAHHVPVTGFVIGQRVESVPSSMEILHDWIGQGFDLGNHSWSHADFNELSIQQIEDEIVRGEPVPGSLMKRAGRSLRFFRFPDNHTGATREAHDAIAAFLGQHGYELATCTIDSSDYVFNDAWIRMLANHDGDSAEKLRREYLIYTSAEIDYYAALDQQVFGYEPPEVMLLHDNRLNADLIGQVLGLFEQKGYRFVSLKEAQSDPAYRTPETYITRFGPMWGYRWAKERNVKVNGSRSRIHRGGLRNTAGRPHHNESLWYL